MDEMDLSASESEYFLSTFMTDRKVILVEGGDDVTKYQNILSNYIDIDIYSIETISKNNTQYYEGGCNSIIEAVNKISTMQNSDDIHQYLLGIIDKDVRNHRTHIEPFPVHKALYVLDLNSIESLYINRLSTKCLVECILDKCSKDLITDNLINQLFIDSVNKTIDHLYYPSLDALKNAIDKSYIGYFGYDDDSGKVHNNTHEYSLSERATLDAFNYPKTLHTLLDICKGKWFLHSWVIFLKKCIVTLKSQCSSSNSVINQCRPCTVKKYDSCNYKPNCTKSNHNKSYHVSIFQHIQWVNATPDFEKINQRVGQMYC